MKKLSFGLLTALFGLALMSIAPIRAAASDMELENADALQMELDESAVDSFVPGHGGGHHDVRFVCYAKNRRGHRFQAIGKNPSRVQERAMEQCYRANSHQCYRLGCNRY